MTAEGIPSLYEWAGGLAALERLTDVFYARIRADEVLAPVFEHMDDEHPRFVAMFIAEVFGGPTAYSEARGGHAHTIRQHLDRHLSELQRRRWVELLIDSADGLTFRATRSSAPRFAAYLEWGTRLAVINRLAVAVRGRDSMAADRARAGDHPLSRPATGDRPVH